MRTASRQSGLLLPVGLSFALSFGLGLSGCGARSASNSDTRVPGDTIDQVPRQDLHRGDHKPADLAGDLLPGELNDGAPDLDVIVKPDMSFLDVRDVLELVDWHNGQCPPEAPIPHDGECVQCIKMIDCPLADHLCVQHQCVPTESAPEECRYCAYSSLMCGVPSDGEGFFCTECLDDFDCGEGFACSLFDRRCCPLMGGNAECMMWDPPPYTHCQDNEDCYFNFSKIGICDTTQPMGLCVLPDGTCDIFVGRCFGEETCMTGEMLLPCIDVTFPWVPIQYKGGLCPCEEALTDTQALHECLASGVESPACLSSECYYGVCVAKSVFHIHQEPESLCGYPKSGLCVPPGPLLEFLQEHYPPQSVPASAPGG